MKKLLLPVAAIAAIFLWQHFHAGDNRPADTTASGETAASSDAIAAAFEERASDRQISGRGVVSRILPDDNDGSRHQRFILRLESGQTVLISHNIDLAPRIEGLADGDAVSFNGVYEWNDRGGVIHWTHRDPQGRHEAGWIRHGGQTYQ